MNRGKLAMILFCCTLYIFMAANIKAENRRNKKQSVNITVIGGDQHDQGSSGGSFEAKFSGKIITVGWDVSTYSNPSAPSVKTYIGNREIKRNLDLYLVKDVIKGKKIMLVGRWHNDKWFQADKIYLPPGTPIIQPYSDMSRQWLIKSGLLKADR